MGAVRILPVGFLLLSASFASVALFAAAPPAGWLRLMPAAGFVTLLTLGQMLSARSHDLIPLFAEESTLGAHYGARSPPQEGAVLAEFTVSVICLTWRSFRRRRRFIPRLLLALFPLCSAVALRAICRPLAAMTQSGRQPALEVNQR